MPNEVVFEVHEAEKGSYYSAAIGYDIITQCDAMIFVDSNVPKS